MAKPATVWIVDDDRSIRWVLEKAISGSGLATEVFESGDALLRKIKREQPDVIISDIRMPGIDGLEMLEQLQADYSAIPTIIMTAHSDLDSAVASYQGGAFEYLPKPFDIDEAVALVQRAVQHVEEQRQQTEVVVEDDTPEIIGEAPAMQEVFRAIGRLSH